jgi:hypothetical protein
MNAAGSDHTRLVIKKAAKTINAENKETTAACATYSGRPVISIIVEAKKW